MTLGRRLRQLRKAKGLTQGQLASPLYTAAYVSTIEAGKRHPSAAALEHFARKLEVCSDELMSGRPPDLVPRLEMELHQARVAVSAGRYHEISSSLDRIAEQAERFHLYDLQAKVCEVRGLWAERRGQVEHALEYYDKAEEILQSAPPPSHADAVAGRARCFAMLGDDRYAVHLLESLLSTLIRSGLEDPQALLRIHSALVILYTELGLFKKAEESASVALSLAPRVADPLRVAQMHMNVARVLLQQSRPADALRSLEQAQITYKQLELRTEMAGAYLASGYVQSRQGDLEAAESLLTMAQSIFEETGDREDQARALNELARVRRLQGQPGRASILLRRSLSLLDQGDEFIAAWAHRELGRCLTDSNRRGAEKHLRTAIDLYERGGHRVELAVTYGVLGDLYKTEGDELASCKIYREGISALEDFL